MNTEEFETIYNFVCDEIDDCRKCPFNEYEDCRAAPDSQFVKRAKALLPNTWQDWRVEDVKNIVVEYERVKIL